MTLQCPAHIEFLLWCYCRCEPHSNLGAPVIAGAVSKFLGAGVIVPKEGCENQWECTELGRAWVKLLVDTPLPRTRYVDQYGKTILEGNK